MKMSIMGRIISILTGVAVFTLLLLAVDLKLPYALIGGVLGWLVSVLILSKKQDEDTINYDSATRQDIEATVKAGKKLTSGMRRAVQKLSQVEIRNEVEDLCRIAESMFEMLKKDPNDLRIVKQFNTHYLEPTHKIICKYAELATIRPMPPDAIGTLERTEKSLKHIRETFLKQKEKMLNNDVMDLDTEIKLFETLSRNINTPAEKTDKESSSKIRKGLY